MIILIGVAATAATLLGGLLALKFRDQLHLVLGFSAGALLGVAFFELLPEALELGRSHYLPTGIAGFFALGFVCYLILDRLVLLHHHNQENCANEQHRGRLAAGTLSLHSFLDGLAIGLGFQVSSAIGLVVTVAVLTHDFSDGINTVGLILKNGGTRAQAFRWLWLDALAPLLGVLATLFFTLPESTLALALALFAGFFLYLGAADLLPESHHAHPTRWTTFATLFGLATLYSIIKIAGV